VQAFGHHGITAHLREHEAFPAIAASLQNACAANAMPSPVPRFLEASIAGRHAGADQQRGRYLEEHPR